MRKNVARKNIKTFLLMLVLVLSLALVGCLNKVEEISCPPDTDVTDKRETEAQTSPEETQPTVETEKIEYETAIYPSSSPNTVFEVDTFEKGTTLGYVAPEGWYSPVYKTGTIIGGDYELTEGVMGLKVYEIQKLFGMKPSIWGYYRSDTIAKVKQFQKNNGLSVTGNVDLETWKTMGFSEESWTSLGSYASPVRIKRTDDRQTMIEQFIECAMEYLDTPYVVGAAGKAGEGVDCSGLVLQCLYAIGIYPDGLDPVQHSTLEEYNSRLMWADEKFKEIEYDELQPGDLVFYGRPWSNRVCHVAIYLGESECVEALSGVVEVLPLHKEDDNYTLFGFKRVLAD